MTDRYAKVKSENENLYTTNKKLWVQIKDNKIGWLSGTQRREGEVSQRESNRWQRKAKKTQEKAMYWENKHSTTFEELTKCRKAKGNGKGKQRLKKYSTKKH